MKHAAVERPMRILVTSDLHFNRPQIEWLARSAPAFDLVVIAGDLLDIARTQSVPEQINEMRETLTHLRSLGPLAVASGNHDASRNLDQGEAYAGWIEDLSALGIIPDGSGCDLGPDRVTVCPWWNGALLRDKMMALLARESALVRNRWLWVHHAPPRGSRIAWTPRGDAGDPYLSKLIGAYQPAIVICGHIHDAPFHANGHWCERLGPTWVFNPGRQPGSQPASIVLDLAACTAEYRNLEGCETIPLEWAK
jgi:Icc-related predicted phosphoesterase